ncbi:hypothetical protein CsSME_00008453 [Camellia sinensis var. sinensis]
MTNDIEDLEPKLLREPRTKFMKQNRRGRRETGQLGLEARQRHSRENCWSLEAFNQTRRSQRASRGLTQNPL